MQHGEDHHGLRPDAVQVAHQLAERDVAHQLEDRGVGFGRRRRVIDHQDQPGEQLDEEEESGKEPEPEGVGEYGAAPLVVTRANMEEEAGGVDFIAGIGLLCGRISTHNGAQFIDAQPGGDDSHPVVQGDHSLLP